MEAECIPGRGGSLNDLEYRLSKCRSLQYTYKYFCKGKYPNMPCNVEGFGKNSLNKSDQFINIMRNYDNSNTTVPFVNNVKKL